MESCQLREEGGINHKQLNCKSSVPKYRHECFPNSHYHPNKTLNTINYYQSLSLSHHFLKATGFGFYHGYKFRKELYCIVVILFSLFQCHWGIQPWQVLLRELRAVLHVARANDGWQEPPKAGLRMNRCRDDDNKCSTTWSDNLIRSFGLQDHFKHLSLNKQLDVSQLILILGQLSVAPFSRLKLLCRVSSSSLP